MGIVDDLIAHPGVYLGIDRDTEGRGESAAKIVITPLPGGAGVTLEYETFNTTPGRIQGHAERAILGRASGGPAVLVTGHSHADTVAVLRESAPGRFELGGEAAAFPRWIELSMPEPGTLVHIWAYGAPGEEAVARDRAEVHLSS